MLSRYSLIYSFVFVTFICMSAANADDKRNPVYVSVSTGATKINESGFDDSLSYGAKIGMELPWGSLVAGYLNMDEFDLQNTSGTYVGVNGYTLSVEKRIQIRGSFFLDLTGGLYFWDASSRFLNIDVGDDNGTNLFIGGAPRYQFLEHFSAFLSLEKYFEVSGADIFRTAIGLSWDF